jgi:hypothetical protein
VTTVIAVLAALVAAFCFAAASLVQQTVARASGADEVMRPRLLLDLVIGATVFGAELASAAWQLGLRLAGGVVAGDRHLRAQPVVDRDRRAARPAAARGGHDAGAWSWPKPTNLARLPTSGAQSVRMTP